MPQNSRQELVSRGLDWPTIMLYAAMVIFGWMNIHAAVYSGEDLSAMFSLDLNSGRQLLFVGLSMILIVAVMTTDFKFYDDFAYIIYGVVIVLLLLVLVIGKEVAGSKSWLGVGSFGIQPAEFAKLATALALAKYISIPTVKLERRMEQLTVAGLIGLPAILVLLQNDTGSTLVFSCFIIVLFREGLPGFYPGLGITAVALLVLTLLIPKLYLSIGLVVIAVAFTILVDRRQRNYIAIGVALVLVLGIVQGVDYFVNDVLQPHQQSRIKVLIDPNSDPLGAGWNVTQSKIAIGSGGFAGKGFMFGTQTKFDFVPAQSTDFIFCTVGEEWGWVGSLGLIGAFMTLLFRITMIAERQKTRFARVYGYGVASVFFFHFTINLGMTVGLFPVIGIPLPFFSYGGSSMLSFTVLLFILLKLDAHRGQMLQRII